MRILWVNHIFLDTDLYATFPTQIIYSLRKRGHKVHLVVPSITLNGDDRLTEDTKFLPTTRLPTLSSLTFFLRLLFYLPKAIKKERPDVIVGNIYEYPGLIVTKLFRKTKLVLDVRDSVTAHPDGGLVERILYYTALKLANRLSDGITVASVDLKEELCAYGINRSHMAVITNGVSLDFFDPDKNIAISKEIRKRLGMSEKFIVMYHGSLNPQRGLQQAIKAIASVKLKHPDIVFFVLGAGTKDYEDKLEKIVKEQSLMENVYLQKMVTTPQVPQFLSICDIGIDVRDIASWAKNSCPLKLCEYLAMGKPVISTVGKPIISECTLPSNKEGFEYGVCGILIPTFDPENIALAIEYMYQKRNSLKRTGKICRDIIGQHYSWDEKAKELEIYFSVLFRDQE